MCAYSLVLLNFTSNELACIGFYAEKTITIILRGIK